MLEVILKIILALELIAMIYLISYFITSKTLKVEIYDNYVMTKDCFGQIEYYEKENANETVCID